MKGTWVITSVFGGLFFLLGLVPVTVSDAAAEEVKQAKCRVDTEDTRTQIGANVRDVLVETDVTVENLSRAGTTQNPNTATIMNVARGVGGDPDDVEVEWDSDIDQGDLAEGARQAIGGAFADVGHMVKVTSSGDSTGKTVTCVEK